MHRILSPAIRYGALAFALASTLTFLAKSFTDYQPAVAAAAGALGHGTIAMVLIVGTLVGVWFEEGLFRWFPIRIARLISADKRVHWVFAIAASIAFGYLHFAASVLHGQWQNIFIQGAPAFVLSAACLRYGYLTAVFAHMVWNAMVIVLVVMLAVVPL